MKKFIILQAIILIFGSAVCRIITFDNPKNNYLTINSYDDLKNIDASFYSIPEEDAWLDQNVETYIDFFDDLYKNVKTHYFDKQILIIEISDKLEVYNDGLLQEIKVKRVIDGNDELCGKTFSFVYPAGLKIESKNEYSQRVNKEKEYGIESSPYSDKPYLNLAGLNIMKPNHEYFIFAQSLKLSDDFTIITADRHQYTWMDLTENKSDIVINNSYSDYYHNEIFTSSQAVLDDYYRIKKEVLEFYNISMY